MAGLIAKIVLGGSLIGIGTILIRKIPILIEIPEEEIEKFDWKIFFLKPFNWIKDLKIFSSDLFLQKILSKVRKKDRKNDNYWEELKKVKNQKDEDLPA
jgi:hypothetical protein